MGQAKIALMADGLQDSAARFSDRADDYVKYRPHYSAEVVRALVKACGLRPEHLVADVGCGPGLLAKVFLDNGNRVTGVEPNPEMRAAGEQYLVGYPGFSMLAGSAEATSLPAASVDFVVAGQAFHWFQPRETRSEFVRVLTPNGWVVLVWHDRDTQSNVFLREYDLFIRRYAVDYEQVTHKYVASYDALQQFFAPDPMQVIHQHSRQRFDFDGLRGRLLSSSYIPKSGPRYEAMEQALPQFFAQQAKDGHVVLDYDTKIYFGHLTA